MKFNNETLRDAIELFFSNENKCKTRYGKIEEWDVSNVTDMSDMFKNAEEFNGHKSDWDGFYPDTHDWDDFSFSNAYTFNKDISNWNVSNVTNMCCMFEDAYEFNKDISNWDVSSVTNMSYMFNSAEAFNQNISNWKVSNVTNMSGMFCNAYAFNQDISKWDVSNVTDMRGMFWNAKAFNQDISNWDVRNVTDMHTMFYGAYAFNQDISKWDVSNVTDMREMFYGANAFNQDISNWDVSSVINMPDIIKNTKLEIVLREYNINEEEYFTEKVSKLFTDLRRKNYFDFLKQNECMYDNNTSTYKVFNITDLQQYIVEYI